MYRNKNILLTLVINSIRGVNSIIVQYYLYIHVLQTDKTVINLY